MTGFGRIHEMWRGKHALSLRDVAQATGYSHVHIRDVELGRKKGSRRLYDDLLRHMASFGPVDDVEAAGREAHAVYAAGAREIVINTLDTTVRVAALDGALTDDEATRLLDVITGLGN